MGAPVNNFTDYAPSCGQEKQSLMQMLANSLITYNGHVYLNLIPTAGYCDTIEGFIDCDNNHIDPEALIVGNAFALDECGHLGLKIFYNNGENDQ